MGTLSLTCGIFRQVVEVCKLEDKHKGFASVLEFYDFD